MTEHQPLSPNLPPDRTHFQIAILGSGFAGLGMALQLMQRGSDDFVVFERADEVGGTWRDNIYPGAACDIRSDLYSFSFAPNPHWAHRYARQPEILEYLKGLADTSGVRRHIRFGHEVLEARWDEKQQLWRLQTSGGAFTARVLISGHGPLIEPKWPSISGLDSFPGARFHSARWDHSAELRGRRIAVIGTGASAVQFVPELQKVAAQLTVFQRTPPWVLPRMDKPTSPRRREVFSRLPLLQRLQRQLIFAGAEARYLIFSNARMGQLAEKEALKHLEAQIPDPDLRRRLTPDYRIGCKRILVSDDYYPALLQPNVQLVSEAIAEVRGAEVLTADGQAREFDVLIGGTGFNATQPPVARLVYGRGGVRLDEAWADQMEALHGTAVSGFPNFFLIVGPNTALGHNSIVYIIEAQIEYILKALEHLDAQHLLSLEARPDAQQTYNDTLQKKLSQSVWVTGGCTSFYLDASGRNSTLWPERASAFRRTLGRFDPDKYIPALSLRPVPGVLNEHRLGGR
jgi:cation diffusion facilitator CzcD-associated flavoprotein CzcO